jgi:hypothetical protein
MRFLTGLVLLSLLVPASAVAQDEPPAESDGVTIAEVPFGIGERMDYRVKFGPLKVGQAHMEVEGLDTVAGNATYHLRFHMSGSVPG